jgi:transcriptional regulator with XRE-family HTH domain
MEIGILVRKIRLQQKRTQQEIADLCGFTKGMLSKIENEKVIPSLATLSKIAKVLGVKVSTLLEKEGTGIAAFSPDAYASGMNFSATDKGYSIFAAAADYTDKKMQPVFVIAREGELKKHLLTHEGEEYIYVLEGEMIFRVANTEYKLKAGESLYFDALQPHGLQKVSEETHYLNMMI